MNLIICALLVSGISINIIEANKPLTYIRPEMLPLWANRGINILRAPSKKLVLLDGGKISDTNSSIVWKGRYNDKFDVAVKVSAYIAQWIRETNALKALDAMNVLNIEKEEIPYVYYYGLISNLYPVIAMTLFDGSLNDLYERYKENISDLQILEIFRQAVHGLRYLQSKNVVHNDIQPQNIFLRGSEILLGDFDMATVNGSPSTDHSEMFASTGYYENRIRQPMDDLESLVFSIWYIAGVPLGISNEAEGKVLSREKKTGKGKARVLAQCKHFKNPKVFEAFRAICADEMLLTKSVPNYDLIIDTLDQAINEISKNSKQVQFHWLTGALSGGPSHV